MSLDLEKMAREFVIAHQPEPLKCIHCGKNQYTGTICSAMAMELCPYSPTNSGHAYQIEITTEAAMFQTEVSRLVDFARSVQKATLPLLQDWMKFSADCVPADATGTEWLDSLHKRTEAAIVAAMAHEPGTAGQHLRKIAKEVENESWE